MIMLVKNLKILKKFVIIVIILVNIEVWHIVFVICNIKPLKPLRVLTVKKIENPDFEYCFVKLNNDDKLVYKCGECKNEWEEPLDHKLIENFPGVYEFSEGDLEIFVLLLRKGVYPYEI